MFILSAERRGDVRQAFATYAMYLEKQRARFPPSAYALASSDWYFDPSVHHAPHDAWLESTTITETTMTIKLLGPYHDGYIELHYPQLLGYRLTADKTAQGHGDWRYDEFRLDEQGRLLHEIEWSDTGNWLIVASDVQHKWLPFDAQPHAGEVE